MSGPGKSLGTKATGAGWQKALAWAVEPHASTGFTVVSLADDGTICVHKTYADRLVAFTQRTRIGNITNTNAYVVTRLGTRVAVYHGQQHRLVVIDAAARATEHEAPMLVEPRPDTGHPARVLARLLVEAVEAYSTKTGKSYAQINRAVGLGRGYIDKMRTAVAANPEHTIDTRTLERILAEIDPEKLQRVAAAMRLEPAAPEKGEGS